MKKIAAFVLMSALAQPCLAAETAVTPRQNWQDKGKAQAALLKQAWDRDPFVAPEKSALPKEQAPLQLTGVFLRNGKKIAIINRSFVKEGETVQGLLVKKIEDNQVLAVRDDKEFYLRISENEKPLKNKPQ